MVRATTVATPDSSTWSIFTTAFRGDDVTTIGDYDGAASADRTIKNVA
jgi:hypothetical protein